MANKI